MNSNENSRIDYSHTSVKENIKKIQGIIDNEESQSNKHNYVDHNFANRVYPCSTKSCSNNYNKCKSNDNLLINNIYIQGNCVPNQTSVVTSSKNFSDIRNAFQNNNKLITNNFASCNNKNTISDNVKYKNKDVKSINITLTEDRYKSENSILNDKKQIYSNSNNLDLELETNNNNTITNVLANTKDNSNPSANNLNKINIFVVGKTGVGKSTLINSIFNDNMAETGHGSPKTQAIEEYTKEGIPFSIIDSKGLEIKDYVNIFNSIEDFIQNRKKSPDNPIHVVWYCISEIGSRLEDGDLNLIKMIKEKYDIPVIIVLTKPIFTDSVLIKLIEKEFPKINIIRVQSIPLKINNEYTLEPSNLKELIELTYQNILQNKEDMAIGISEKINFDLKIERSLSIIKKYALEKNIKINNIINYEINMVSDISNIFGLKKKSIFIFISNFFGDRYKIEKINKNLLCNEESKENLSDNISLLIENFGNMYLNVLSYLYKNKIEISEQVIKDTMAKEIKYNYSMFMDYISI